MKYKQYLQSAQWKRIRARVLQRDRYTCRSCDRRATQVHHARYDADTMAGRTLEHLFSLCGPCHEATTFTVTGERRTKNEVFAMAQALILTKRKRERRKKRQRKPRTQAKRPEVIGPCLKPRKQPARFTPMRGLSRGILPPRIYDPKR